MTKLLNHTCETLKNKIKLVLNNNKIVKMLIVMNNDLSISWIVTIFVSCVIYKNTS